MDEFEDAAVAFVAAVSARLDEYVWNIQSRNDDAAVRAMEVTVALCEQHPAYAVRPSPRLGSSVQKVISGCLSNAIAKGRGGPKMSDLLVRINEVGRSRVH